MIEVTRGIFHKASRLGRPVAAPRTALSAARHSLQAGSTAAGACWRRSWREKWQEKNARAALVGLKIFGGSVCQSAAIILLFCARRACSTPWVKTRAARGGRGSPQSGRGEPDERMRIA